MEETDSPEPGSSEHNYFQNVKRKVQGVSHSKATANTWHQEEKKRQMNRGITKPAK